ncbi:hypothetical protein [Mycolicibacterium fallax]|uniref:Uncharacterized protein n=1 Tax=Mycolicibacterium fallax TaxID=1793 RepID=A0A1X1RN60_MYCFA|nr:hypothetical protein [Mycolicibacterium fallax]ORV10043.1 hypothetical protein AWC04_01045 [Mycolicibacterium fallax]BBY98351.1 hypothetical protein MFAL_18180 [Mycolicibacterium fallax]
MSETLRYNPAAYTDAAEGHVWCRVTVTLPDGGTRTATGDYLDAAPIPVLCCGIEEAAKELGLLHYLDDERLYLKVCAEVDRQLSWRPLVRLSCRQFSIRLDLVEPQ